MKNVGSNSGVRVNGTGVEEDSAEAQEFYEALGRLVVSSARLENGLCDLYAKMLGSSMGGLVAVGQSFEAVRQACASIVTVRDDLEPDVRDRAAALLTDANAIWQRRNIAVHAIWVPHTDRASLISLRVRRWNLEQSAEPWTAVAVRALAKKFRELGERVDEFIRLFPADPKGFRGQWIADLSVFGG